MVCNQVQLTCPTLSLRSCTLPLPNSGVDWPNEDSCCHLPLPSKLVWCMPQTHGLGRKRHLAGIRYSDRKEFGRRQRKLLGCTFGFTSAIKWNSQESHRRTHQSSFWISHKIWRFYIFGMLYCIKKNLCSSELVYWTIYWEAFVQDFIINRPFCWFTHKGVDIYCCCTYYVYYTAYTNGIRPNYSPHVLSEYY